MSETILLLLFALAGVLVGALFGALAVSLFGRRGAAQGGPRRPDPQWKEVARFWRPRVGGSLVVEMDRRRYRSLSELTREQRAELNRLAHTLRRALGETEVVEPSPPPSATPEPQPPGPTGETQGAETPAAATLDGVSQLAASQVAAPSVSASQAAGPPAPSARERFARLTQPDLRGPGAGEKSIAQQIDEILQERLSGSPLEKRAIRLMELPEKGMVVMVGLEQYDSVDAVPDEDIRDLIRQAVAEWERRVS